MSAAPSQPTPAVDSRPSRADVAKTLAEAHFKAEPDLQAVYVFPESDGDDADRPIALLEINASTFASGSITPFAFTPTKDVPYPVLIAEVTPKEFESARKGSLELPQGWDLEHATLIERPQR